jgi:hypothetical protein
VSQESLQLYDRQYHHSRIMSGPVSVLSDVDPAETTMKYIDVDIAHLGGDTSIQVNCYIPVYCPCDNSSNALSSADLPALIMYQGVSATPSFLLLQVATTME